MQSIDSQTLRDLESSRTEVVKNPVTGAETKWTTPADASELDPEVQMQKYLANVQRLRDSGQISQKVLTAARAELIFQTNQRHVADVADINMWKQKAEQWAMTSNGPAENVPSDIYDGLRKHNELGALADIQYRADSKHASAIKQQITNTQQELHPYTVGENAIVNIEEDIKRAKAQIAGGKKVEDLLPDMRAHYEMAAQLPEMKKRQAQLQTNVKMWQSALDRMATPRTGIPLDVAPAEDPLDAILREIQSTPAPWPANTGRGK
jgi:hypothetical protein